MATAPRVQISNYQLHLEGFEGPLDVLLQLIERQRLDISELSLVAVTDGFLAYIDQMEDPPPRLLGEFVGIAARLLVLKSRSLLPRPETHEPDEDVDDLAERLREYQRIKQIAAGMRDSQESGWRSYVPQASGPQRQVNISLQTPEPGALKSLFLRAIARQPAAPDVAPIRPVISVAEMAGRIIRRILRPGSRAYFYDIVEGGSRQEVVAGFVALLTLWGRRELHVSQAELFGDIELQSAGSKEAGG